MSSTSNAALVQQVRYAVEDLADKVRGVVGTQLDNLADAIMDYLINQLKDLLVTVGEALESATAIASQQVCLRSIPDRALALASTWGMSTSKLKMSSSFKLMQRLQEAAGVLGTDFCFQVKDIGLSSSGVKFKMEAYMAALSDEFMDWTPKSRDSPLNSPKFKAAIMLLGMSKKSEQPRVLKLIRGAFGLKHPLNTTIDVGQVCVCSRIAQCSAT